MKEHIAIPVIYKCEPCKVCGARPVIKTAEDGLYLVRCPDSDDHYQTMPGLIDLSDWNLNNILSAQQQG